MLNKCMSQCRSACFGLNAVHSLKFQPVLVFFLQTRPPLGSNYFCYFISCYALFLLHHFLCLSRYTFCRAFLTALNELNDYAGQHEVIAENLTSQIISELSRYLQELKTERKSVSGLFFAVFFPFIVFGFSVFICLS